MITNFNDIKGIVLQRRHRVLYMVKKGIARVLKAQPESYDQKGKELEILAKHLNSTAVGFKTICTGTNNKEKVQRSREGTCVTQDQRQ